MNQQVVKIIINGHKFLLPKTISGAELKQRLHARRLRIRIGALCREVDDNDKLNLEVSRKKIVFEEF